MQDGFIKVAAATPEIEVANITYNLNAIKALVKSADEDKVKLLVFPELCITGYTCEDLFFQPALIKESLNAIINLKDFSKDFDMVIIVGAPISFNNSLYNCAVVIHKGEVLGIVPKTHIPNYNEFYEKRHFANAPLENVFIDVNGEEVLFGTNIIFRCSKLSNFSFGVEICEDLWVVNSPSNGLALNGANIIANLSASNEIIGKEEYRRMLVKTQSAKLVCGYIYADAGAGESTTDLVFAGHNIIAENGAVLIESELFDNDIIISEIDVDKLANERAKLNTFENCFANCDIVMFDMEIHETSLTREFERFPFVPIKDESKAKVCDRILQIQAHGLKKRLIHSRSEKLVIGISGGLDSCLALIVAVKTMELLGKPAKDIIAVTMPCFGTSDRTKNNAIKLSSLLGVTLREIDITNAVLTHFNDIGQNSENYDVTYENSQARERTQVLMDIANKEKGLVIGTGDLSEMALGWSTYNGDHMSMYAVNSSVPKTLIRHIIGYYCDKFKNTELKDVLSDILDTPVSPELLPGKAISQKTEDIVGPYELHDFFIYYVIRMGFEPKKVLRIAKLAFNGIYDDETILKWLKTFYKRFFTQQFKRTCIPDGPKVGTVALSPRGDLRMPSDAVSDIWLDQLK